MRAERRRWHGRLAGALAWDGTGKMPVPSPNTAIVQADKTMDNRQQSRRSFNAQALGSLLSLSLLETLARHESVCRRGARRRRPLAGRRQSTRRRSEGQLDRSDRLAVEGRRLAHARQPARRFVAGRFRSTDREHQVRRPGRTQPADHVSQGRRRALRVELWPADVRPEQRTLGHAARPQQHGHGVSRFSRATCAGGTTTGWETKQGT